MKRPAVFVFLFLTIVLISCTNKSKNKSITFQSSAGEIQVSIISTRHYDSGITGAPHAPIIIPYVNKEIFNAVSIKTKSGDSLIVDDLAEYTDLLTNDEMNDLVSKISILTSPDGKNILYKREKAKGDTILIVHQFPSGKLFYSGKYEAMYRESVTAKKDFDWKIIPSFDSIVHTMLLDTISNSVGDAVFINGMLAQVHPNKADEFALENFGENNLATTYIEEFCTDEYWKAQSKNWKQKILAKVGEVEKTIERNGMTVDENNVKQSIMQNLLSLEKIAKSDDIAFVVDTFLCGMSMKSNYAGEIFYHRLLDDNITIPASQSIVDYYHKLAIENMDFSHSKKGLVFQTAYRLQDTSLFIACAKKLVKTWPEDLDDSLNENPLAAYYDDLNSDLQKQMHFNAERYLTKGKIPRDAYDILFYHSSCEQLAALRKRHPGIFVDSRTDCDTIPTK